MIGKMHVRAPLKECRRASRARRSAVSVRLAWVGGGDVGHGIGHLDHPLSESLRSVTARYPASRPTVKLINGFDAQAG